jgi:hypothetical protein
VVLFAWGGCLGLCGVVVVMGIRKKMDRENVKEKRR